MEFKETKHSYYCNPSNYYVGNRNGENYGRCDYENWNEFKEDWIPFDLDYNLLFRYDIEKEDGELSLWLFFMLQRKGIYTPVCIKRIEENDMVEIENMLKESWKHLKKMWCEIEGKPKEEK